MCVFDEHLLAGRDIQYRAPDSQSRYTTPFNKIKSNMQHAKQSWIPMILVIINVIAFCNQGKPCTCVQNKLGSCICKQDKLCTHV